ncbi:MAG: alpha/beta hydrolase [Ramlibacter sp.]|nr:alpha/beta hydrolase [Ramlibacter sp.]
MRLLSWSWVLLWAGMLFGCFPRGDPSKPIPTFLVNAPQKAQRLVVVLPGRGDDLDDLRKSGIAQAVQSAWPDADVVLTGLALGYYMEGQPDQRLHDEVIVPARRRGYQQVWLVGASMGAMGAVMYDRAYANDVTGMVLLAPYLGEHPVLSDIAAAGGAAAWQPPPKPASINPDNFQQELWRHLQSWSRQPAAARNVWLAYGKTDRLREAVPLLAPLLPPGHVLVREGGHEWSVWTPAARDVLLQIDRERDTRAKAAN